MGGRNSGLGRDIAEHGRLRIDVTAHRDLLARVVLRSDTTYCEKSKTFFNILLARIIHKGFYSNRVYAAATSLAA